MPGPGQPCGRPVGQGGAAGVAARAPRAGAAPRCAASLEPTTGGELPGLPQLLCINRAVAAPAGLCVGLCLCFVVLELSSLAKGGDPRFALVKRSRALGLLAALLVLSAAKGRRGKSAAFTSPGLGEWFCDSSTAADTARCGGCGRVLG